MPVLSKGNYFQAIGQVRIDNSERWAAKHWRTLLSSYRRTTYFDEIAALIEPLYCRMEFTYLSELNRAFIAAISEYLDIDTVVTSSSQYPSDGGKSERLLQICKATEATEYLSGPSAKSYLDEALFSKQGVSVAWFSYEGYRPYPQPWGDFVHEVSILDLLFTKGKNAKQYMKGFGCNS